MVTFEDYPREANAAMNPDGQFPRAAVVRRYLHLPEVACAASKSA